MPESAYRPWHRWPVGLIALICVGAGALDYTLSWIGFAPYVERLPQDWAGWLAAQPGWISILWAVAVFAGVLGAVLLLMAERGAVLAFALAFLASLAAGIGLVLVSDADLPVLAGLEPGVWIATAVAAQFLFWLYARWLKIRGALG